MKNEFTAERMSRSAEYIVDQNIEKLFPLYGPIEEMKWAHGWSPDVIYSNNGKIEEGFTFRVEGHHASEGHYTWIISKYQPENHLVLYTVFTANRVWTIEVACSKLSETSAKTKVTYTYTGLNEEGNSMNKSAMARIFKYDLRDWKKSIEHYFQTGLALEEYAE